MDNKPYSQETPNAQSNVIGLPIFQRDPDYHMHHVSALYIQITGVEPTINAIEIERIKSIFRTHLAMCHHIATQFGGDPLTRNDNSALYIFYQSSSLQTYVRNAILAGLAMQKASHTLEENCQHEGLLKISFGTEEGQALITRSGAERTIECTAIAHHAMNMAKANDRVGAPVISEHTCRHLDDDMKTERLDTEGSKPVFKIISCGQQNQSNIDCFVQGVFLKRMPLIGIEPELIASRG